MPGWTQSDLERWEKQTGRKSVVVSAPAPQPAALVSKRSRSGRRADLGNVAYRSAWEANIARYLNWLMQAGAVSKWDYEQAEYWFPIKRGTRQYKVDFRIWWTRDPEVFVVWEVKGYMDRVSKTKLARMARYHPHIKIEVIGKAEYAAIKERVKHAIPYWE